MGKRSRKRARAGLEPPAGRRPMKGQDRVEGQGRPTVQGPSQGQGRVKGHGRVTRHGRVTPRGAGGDRRGATTGFDHLLTVEDTLLAALVRIARGDDAGADGHVEALAGWWDDGVGRQRGVTPGAVPALLCSYLAGEVGDAWARGWQPADLHRVVRRQLAAPHLQMAVEAMAEQAEEYRAVRPALPSWLDQLDEIGAAVGWGPADDHLTRLGADHHLDHRGVLLCALQLLVLVRGLPELPRLCPPPSDWGRSAALDAAVRRRRAQGDVDVRYLERIRGLLAKAESTEFDEEAASLTAKAHELMTRHAIDAALVEAHAAGRAAGEQPVAVRIGIDDPYAQAKTMLLAVIGNVTRCRTVWTKEFGFATVFGFADDLQSVELLYTSLLLQARSAMARAGELGSWARNRGFRQSFLVGFADRIGTRLREAAEAAVAGAEAEAGGALLPLLAERVRRVDDLRDGSFGPLEQVRFTAHNRSGWVVGTQAADEAQLSFGAPLEERATA